MNNTEDRRVIFSYSLVAPEEVRFPTWHPEKGSVDPVRGQPSAQFLDVFWVAGIQSGFVENPVLVTCKERGNPVSHNAPGPRRLVKSQSLVLSADRPACTQPLFTLSFK